MSSEATVIELNQKLLNSIAAGDYDTYSSLCANDLTCFEPETKGVVVQGTSFHKYYFDLDKALSSTSTTETSNLPIKNISMAGLHSRVLNGDNVVVLAYTRLDQSLDGNNAPVSKTCTETRVWENRDGNWLHVHFHKS